MQEQIRLDKLAIEKAKQEAEKLESDRRLQLEKEKIAAELEIRRMQLQNERDIDQKKIENQRIIVEVESETKRHEIYVWSTASSSTIEHDSSHGFRKYELGIGRFDNIGTTLEPFILKFEVVANAYKLPVEL